jgi:hypothetical protein
MLHERIRVKNTFIDSRVKLEKKKGKKQTCFKKSS